MSKAWVKGVEPQGLHGFRAGELKLEELSEGLNVVWAPNASGKSTLAKAIGLLFDPAECDAETLVIGVLGSEIGDQNVSAKKKSGKFGGFPGRALDYRLDLPQLLSGYKKGESPLDKEIGSGLKFVTSPPTAMHRLKEVEEAKSALERLRSARRDKAAVAEVEDDLPRLHQRAAEAGEASRMAAALEALEHRLLWEAEQSEKEALYQALLAQHPGIELQAPDALRHAEELARSLEEARNAAGTARTRLSQIVADGRKPGAPLSELDRVGLQAAIGELAEARGALKTLEGIVASEHAKALVIRDHLLNLLPDEDPDDLPIPPESDLQSLATAAAQADSSRQAELQTKACLALLAEWRRQFPEPSPDADRKIQQLVAWLAAEPQASEDRRPILLLVLMVVATIALALVPLPIVRFALAAGAVVLGALLWRFGHPLIATRPDLAGLVTGEPSAAAVAEELADALRQRSGSEVAVQLEAQARIQPVEFDWQGIAERLRLKCSNPYMLAPVSANLVAYCDARVRSKDAENELVRCRQRESQARANLGVLLDAYGFPYEAGQEAGAAEVFPHWFARSEELSQAEARIGRSEAALCEHLTRNGAPVEDGIAILHSRTDQAIACRQLKERIERLSEDLANQVLDEERLARTLGPGALDRAWRPVSEASARSVTIDRVRQLHTEQLQLSSESDARHQALADAKAKVEAAEQVSISTHEMAYEAALAKVETKWRTLIGEAVKARIHHAIKEKLSKEDLPPIVQSASEHLARFTGDRYRLQLGSDQSNGLGLLLLSDKRTGKVQSFDQLSTGTKAHAIIALRLALIGDQEMNANGGNIQFPLIADEALAVSDPQAARSIADALVKVARERQVIVFTNQPDDAVLFQRLDPTMKLIELGTALPASSAPPRRRTPRSESTEAIEQPPLGF